MVTTVEEALDNLASPYVDVALKHEAGCFLDAIRQLEEARRREFSEVGLEPVRNLVFISDRR